MKKININNFEEKLIFEKLENGLEVYLVPMKNKKTFFTMFGTKFGGVDLEFKVDDKEYTVPSGVAHFLEHKLFEQNETPFEFYGRTGTDVNASTSLNWTGYYFTGNNNFMENLKYLLNWITNFHITEEQVKKEQGIILEEARMYQDNPDRVMYEKLKENTLINSKFKEKVIGTLESIKKITKEDLYLCYETFYRPSNMFLIIVGDFSYEETLNLIKEELKDFKDDKKEVTKIIKKEPNRIKKEKEVLNFPVETPKIAISYKIDKKDFETTKLDKYQLDYYIQMLFTLILGAASDFREYLLEKELFISIGHSITDIKSHYLIEIYATTNQKEELLEELDKYISNIKNIFFKKEDFNRIKKTWIASEIRMIDNVNATLYNILDDILEYNEYKNNSINDKKSLDFDMLNEVKNSINFSNKSVIVIDNEKNKV